MIKIDLIEALQKQIAFCKNEKRYKCGVYTKTHEQRKIVMEVIKNLEPNTSVRIRTDETQAVFDGGNYIKAISANHSARGNKFNGLIIENNIDKGFIENIAYATIVPIYFSDKNEFESNRVLNERIDYVDISYDDVIKSEKYKSPVYECWDKYRRDQLDAMLWSIRFKNKNYSIYEKEYKNMFYENNYDRPVVEKELNLSKVLLYEALGIPKDMITYSTEFINKTKETYLNIVGKHENEKIGFENDINIHLRIDTDIYDGYEVHIEDGLVSVYLHEIKNEKPVLKDYGVA